MGAEVEWLTSDHRTEGSLGKTVNATLLSQMSTVGVEEGGEAFEILS